ncbi:MAG: DNA-binding protein WhiA [Oscillospiraceae bacterium]|jgi:DNA-binding protein WhiA|nr:DNA-binding protein WhiA [Oscillospiraceae bacterium]
MSFSSEVKTELCRRLKTDSGCCARAAAYGVLLYANRFSQDLTRIVTENDMFAAIIPELMKSAFGVEIDGSSVFGRMAKTALIIESRSKINKLFNTIGYETEYDPALHINLGMMECDDCRNAFVRGAFLSGGSVTDPTKRYHLEMVTTHYYVHRETLALLRELDIDAKSSVRNGTYMLYLKRSGEIEDALTLMGAPLSAMAMMNAKLEKELRGRVSRRVNCDVANAGRMVNAAAEQLEVIRRLQKEGSLSLLTEPLQAAAALRLKYPEASLAELAAYSGVSKSGLAHRFKKIMQT